MFNNLKRILIIAPHADDAELGCGGTIARLIGEKKELFLATFSVAEKNGNQDEVRKEEQLKSAKILGIRDKNLILYKYPIRRFSDYSHEIRDVLFILNKKIRPDVVFLPARNDVHQDHEVIFKEGLRVFKHNTFLCYEFPWNNYKFFGQFFVELRGRDISKKIQALRSYKSQGEKVFMDSDIILNYSKLRGVQAGLPFAEAFEIVRIKYNL